MLPLQVAQQWDEYKAPRLWIRTTAAADTSTLPPRYAWEQIYQQEAGVWAVDPNGQSSGVDDQPAYMVTGSSKIPAGTICEAIKHYGGWLIAWPIMGIETVCITNPCKDDAIECITVLAVSEGPCDVPSGSGSGSGSGGGFCSDSCSNQELCLILPEGFDGSPTSVRLTPMEGGGWESETITIIGSLHVTAQINCNVGLIWFYGAYSATWGASAEADTGAGQVIDCSQPNTYSGSTVIGGLPILPSSVTVLIGSCAAAPAVYRDTDDICQSTTTLTIHGRGFLPTGNTVAFSPTGTGTATYVNSTTLSITALTGQSVGALYATVTNANGTSNTAQVATVEPAPTVTVNTSNVTQATGPFTFHGTGLVPITSLAMSSGTFSILSESPTSTTINFTVAPSLGPLIVTSLVTPCGTVTNKQVATIVSGGGGGISFTALGSSNSTSSPLTYGVTLGSAGELVVNVLVLGGATGVSAVVVTYSGTGGGTLTQTQSAGVGVSQDYLYQFALSVATAGSGNITVTTAGGTPHAILSNAYLIGGASSFVADATATAIGSLSAPDTGVSTAATADGGAIAAFGFDAASGIGSLAWSGGFTGDSAVYETVTYLGTPYYLVTGHMLISSGNTFDAAITGITNPANWEGLGDSFRP